MQKIIKSGLIILFLISCIACKNKKDETIVASYLKEKLYISDILNKIPGELSKEDSTYFIKNYIKTWTEKQVFLDAALHYLDKKELDFDKQLEDYKNDLIIDQYFQKLLKEKTPDNVMDYEIQAFYTKNKSNLNLTDEIIQANYVKIRKNSPLIPKIKKLLFDDNQRKANHTILEKMFGDSIEYYLDDNSWIRFSEILTELPINPQNRSEYLKNNKHIEIYDKDYCYLITIINFKTGQSNMLSQKDIDNIKNLIIHQKANQYIESKKQDLYNQAIQKNKIKVY